MFSDIEHIWEDMHLELSKFITGKVKDADLRNDILQDVFLKIHSNIHTLKDGTKLTAWIYQITRNTIADHYRKSKKTHPLEAVELAEEETAEPLYQSLSHCLNQKISSLPEKYKQAILLTAFENYSQIALAEQLGTSYSGAKTRVQRAREKLKELILACNNLESDNKGNPTEYHNPE